MIKKIQLENICNCGTKTRLAIPFNRIIKKNICLCCGVNNDKIKNFKKVVKNDY